jgi:hypothetical protein
MTRGALIFAFNNEKTDYVAMAQWSADRIRRHLNIPVAVVTDLDPRDPRVSGFDRVITTHASSGGTRWFEDYADTVTWYNAGRIDAFRLTPWDHTLLLDADYVVCSNQLNNLWDVDTDFLCHKNAWDMKTGLPLDGLNTYGRFKMPVWWATVVCFKRTNFSQYVFDAMTMVRENWQHYRDLYQIDRATYRNDFALSIALGIVSGHTLRVDEIPWDLASAMPDTELGQLDDDCFSLQYKSSHNVLRTVSISSTDFHAMGKQHLENIIATH